MVPYCQPDPWEKTSVQFESNCVFIHWFESSVCKMWVIFQLELKVLIHHHLKKDEGTLQIITHSVAWDPFYEHGLTLISAWIVITSIKKCGLKLLIHFLISNSCTVEVWERISTFIPDFTGMWLLIHFGVSVRGTPVRCRLPELMLTNCQCKPYEGTSLKFTPKC